MKRDNGIKMFCYKDFMVTIVDDGERMRVAVTNLTRKHCMKGSVYVMFDVKENKLRANNVDEVHVTHGWRD